MRGLSLLYCVTIVFALARLSNCTTEPLPELVAHEQQSSVLNLNDSEKEEKLLDVDAGAVHETSNREARQFGFRRGFGGGGFRRGGFGGGGFGRGGRHFGFGGFRPYGFYRPPFYGGYRPPFYGGYYRPPFYGGYRPPFYYRPPPFYPYYGFRPGFYG